MSADLDRIYEERDARTKSRMQEVVRAGRMTQELLDVLGLTGSPGFMGRGTFPTEGRAGGYRR